MGYFANAAVFTSEPDFAGASAVVPDMFACGYKHNERPLWLLDLWKPRGKILRRVAPFCDSFLDGFQPGIAEVDPSTRDFLTKFECLRNALGNDYGQREVAYIHLALALARGARRPAYLFAADDNDLDLGCRVTETSLVGFGCRYAEVSLAYCAGQTSVTPLDVFTEEGQDGLQEVIDNASRVPGIKMENVREIDDGLPIFENPVAQWPSEAGDPVEVLGLGTWDPLMNVETDFSVVFERTTK